jgi:hypothetical protein
VTRAVHAHPVRGAYTRLVCNWTRRAVGLLVLVVLSAAPAVATACALICDARAGAASTAHRQHQSHQASAMSCHDVATPDQPRVSEASDCALHHDGGAQSTVALMASRADVDIVAVAASAAAARVSASMMTLRQARGLHGSPPDRPPAALATLALRI